MVRDYKYCLTCMLKCYLQGRRELWRFLWLRQSIHVSYNIFLQVSLIGLLKYSFSDRLKGQWGINDVDDSVNSVKQLAGSNKVDPNRITITGGSAGGYTVLNSMCSVSGVFAAGTSSYGISNLFNLATGTHKFESRYLDGLLGGTPEQVPDVYKDRSPYYHADKITSPLLVSSPHDRIRAISKRAVDSPRIHRSRSPT